jgi:hypothetical protein
VPKPIKLSVDVEESQVGTVMRLLHKTPGVVSLNFDLGESKPHGNNGAVRSPRAGTKRAALLKALTDGKPHDYDEIRQRTGQTIKEFHNTRYNAVRDGFAKIVGDRMLQIGARGIAQLKASGK